MRKKLPELTKCRVRSCKAVTDRYMPFCRTHWRMISIVLQDDIKEAWRRRKKLEASGLIREAEEFIQGGENEKARKINERSDDSQAEGSGEVERTLF